MLVSESVVSESACRFNKADMQDDQPKLNPYISLSFQYRSPVQLAMDASGLPLHMKYHYCFPKKTQPIATDNVEVAHQN